MAKTDTNQTSGDQPSPFMSHHTLLSASDDPRGHPGHPHLYPLAIKARALHPACRVQNASNPIKSLFSLDGYKAINFGIPALLCYGCPSWSSLPPLRREFGRGVYKCKIFKSEIAVWSKPFFLGQSARYEVAEICRAFSRLSTFSASRSFFASFSRRRFQVRLGANKVMADGRIWPLLWPSKYVEVSKRCKRWNSKGCYGLLAFCLSKILRWSI